MRVLTTAAGASHAARLQAAIEAERIGFPFLVVADREDGQRIYILEPEDERVWIGRSSGCEIVLDWDERISRSHAELESSGRGWTIDDDGVSRNGTFVGGERIRGRKRLGDRDVIRVGDSTIQFRAPSVQSTAAATVAGLELPAAVSLTESQRRVLVALCRPLLADEPTPIPATNQQIASELYLSLDAVKTHMRALFDRFGVGDLAQNAKRTKLAEIALATGAVTRHDA